MPRYEFTTKPYHHQAAALSKMRRGGFGGALLMEPRTGKTWVAINWMCIEALKVENPVKKWVVVAPKRVIGVWKEQIGQHAGTIDGRKLSIQIQDWHADARRMAPPRRPHPSRDLSIVLVNYDAFAGENAQRNVARLLAWMGTSVPTPTASQQKRLKRRRSMPARVKAPAEPCGMVLDESHYIKNPSGRWAQMIVSLQPMFERRMIMTGTPVTGAERIADLRMQWKFLNPSRFADIDTDAEFRDYYARWEDKGGWKKFIMFRPFGFEDIKKRIARDSYAISRAECFDIPDPEPRNVYVTLNEAERKAYSELAKQMITEIEGGVITASTAAVKSLRLSQIAAGVGRLYGSETLVRLGRSKLDALEELLEESFENGEKVVVACRFREDIRAILEIMEKRWKRIPAYRLDGTTDAGVMHRNLARFRDEPGPQIHVIQPKAGGVGIDLSTAARFIWYTLDLSWTNYRQCTDRVALNPHCDIVHILAQKTVDGRHLRALQGDGEIGKWILEHPIEVLLGQD